MRIRNIAFPTLFLLLPMLGQAQAWKWAKPLGSPNHATSVKSIEAYAGTGALVGGSFAANTLTLGSQMLNNAGQDDGFVAITDEEGQYAWAASIGGTDKDFVVHAAAAPNGDFMVVGNFRSHTMNIGGTNLLNTGESDIFVVRYKEDKSIAWALKISTPDVDEVSSVAMDAAGNAYVSGQVLDKFTLTTLFVFVRKIGATGTLLWERKGTMQGGLLYASAFTLDDEQAVYLGGSIYGSATFGTTNLSSDTSFAAFIVKYSPDGSLLDTYTNPGLEKFNGLQSRGSDIFACAEKKYYGIGWGWPLSSSMTHVLKLNSNLDAVWHKTAGGMNQWQSLDIAKSLSVDDVGNVYVTGSFFSDTLHFAGQALPNLFNESYYYPQIFVLKYSPSGNEIWGKSLGGTHSDEATCIHAIGEDLFYLGGNFESNPVSFGAYNLNNTGSLDSLYVHQSPARYGRQTMGFLAFFDKTVNSTKPEPAFGEVTIFPNPANDLLTVRLKQASNSPLTFQVLATDGRLLRQTNYSDSVSEIREDLTGLPPGVYFVSLQTERGAFAGKFVKM